jgi:hypothetical protein
VSERDELLARLRGCNPPDRTIDEQRPLAQMIHDAADLLERDGAEIARLRVERDREERECGEVMDERDRYSDALAESHIALGGDGEWAARTWNPSPPDSGDLARDVPALSAAVKRDLDEARAALAKAQRDAERYRLMRRNPTVDGESLVVVEVLEFNEDGPTDVYYAYAGDPLDAVIDAAIAKEQSHASE